MSDDYPRMMFHRQQEPVIVQSEQDEAALGAEWSRIVQPRDPPPQENPPDWVAPEPEPLPEEPPKSELEQPRKPVRKRV